MVLLTGTAHSPPTAARKTAAEEDSLDRRHLSIQMEEDNTTSSRNRKTKRTKKRATQNDQAAPDRALKKGSEDDVEGFQPQEKATPAGDGDQLINHSGFLGRFLSVSRSPGRGNKSQ